MAAAAGLAGGSIEDATGDPSRPIYDFDLAVERIQAAVETARALPVRFVLTARAENLLHGRLDLDDTIRRLQAFEKAGADVLYAPGDTRSPGEKAGADARRSGDGGCGVVAPQAAGSAAAGSATTDPDDPFPRR